MRTPSTYLRPIGWLLALLLVLTTAFGAQAADAYKLGLSDKVSVRVVKWDAAQATLTEWAAVSGDYVVGADGALSFPLVGSVPAAGKTTAELGTAIATGIGNTLGLTNPPNVTVEVTTFGPVYVTGDVQAPGAYPFAPGLSVIKVVSLAGGLRRSSDPADRTDRDVISMQGQYDVLRDQYVRLLVHRAQLDAVLGNHDSISVPTEVTTASVTPALVAVETSLMQAGKQQLTTQLSALDDQKSLLTKGLDTLAQKRETTSKELDAVQAQLAKVQGLAANGLAVTDRVQGLQQTVGDLEGRMLDIDSATLKANQDMGTTEDQSAKLKSDEFITKSQEREQVDSQVAETELKMAMQERLVQEAIAYGGAPAGSQAVYSYGILRNGKQITADVADPVEPGDVVTVTISPASH